MCSINITQAHSFDKIIIVLVFVDALVNLRCSFSFVVMDVMDLDLSRQVDLARKRAGRPPPLEETLPRHARHIRDANLELFESFVREFRGAEVL